jgi:hypothetical protein
MGKYRYVFLRHPDDERVLAAFELFTESKDAAEKLALDCLNKSDATLVEVWSGGELILHVTRAEAAAAA